MIVKPERHEKVRKNVKKRKMKREENERGEAPLGRMRGCKRRKEYESKILLMKGGYCMQTLIELHEHKAEGYLPLVDFESWRVAILNRGPEEELQNIDYMGVHDETDEVFVLLTGRCVLFVAEEVTDASPVHAYDMIPGTVYNVKKGVWHTHALSADASVLIVENQNTTWENSRKATLPPKQLAAIREKGAEHLG